MHLGSNRHDIKNHFSPFFWRKLKYNHNYPDLQLFAFWLLLTGKFCGPSLSFSVLPSEKGHRSSAGIKPLPHVSSLCLELIIISTLMLFMLSFSKNIGWRDAQSDMAVRLLSNSQPVRCLNKKIKKQSKFSKGTKYPDVTHVPLDVRSDMCKDLKTCTAVKMLATSTNLQGGSADFKTSVPLCE